MTLWEVCQNRRGRGNKVGTHTSRTMSGSMSVRSSGSFSSLQQVPSGRTGFAHFAAMGISWLLAASVIGQTGGLLCEIAPPWRLRGTDGAGSSTTVASEGALTCEVDGVGLGLDMSAIEVVVERCEQNIRDFLTISCQGVERHVIASRGAAVRISPWGRATQRPAAVLTTRRQTLKGTLRGHVGAVYRLAWSADGRMLVSASKDATVKVNIIHVE